MIPTSIDGTDITGATIDGTDVQEITVDGDVVFSGGFDPLIIDNFEDAPNGPYGGGDTLGDYWTVSNYSISDWDRSTTNTIEGNRTLRWISGDEGLQTLVSFDGDGLPNYPSKGQIFSGFVRTDSEDNNPVILFGLDGTATNFNCYGVRLYNFLNEIDILRFDNAGSVSSSFSTTLQDLSITITDDEIYEMEVEWHDGTGNESDNTIVYTVYNVNQSTLARTGTFASIQANDSNYPNDSGVGFGFVAGRTVDKSVFDQFRIIGNV